MNSYKNHEGYHDPTAGEAINAADRPPRNVTNFRRGVKLLAEICHIHILGKITVIDEKGRRW